MASLVRLRQFAYRHRRWLAGLYLLLVLVVGGGLWAYVSLVPDDVDLGLTIAARAWFYRDSFAAVEAAEHDLEQGESGRASAQARLEEFLAEHAQVQPAQLWSHAVARAGVLLAELHVANERPMRGAEAIEPLLERLPLDYTLWWAHGRALEADGEFAAAAKSLRRAFELTLHHPGIVEDYLGCLNEINAFAETAWVADEWERALVRAAPKALLKVGIPRRPLERRVLSAVGIDVEQGRFFRHLEKWGMPRGAGCRVEFPPAMFEPWGWHDELVVQLRLDQLWDGFTVDLLEIERRDGRVERRVPQVGYLHRDGSGVNAYAELFTGVPGDEVARVTLTYSCAAPELSAKAQRAIAKARANLAPAAARGG